MWKLYIPSNDFLQHTVNQTLATGLGGTGGLTWFGGGTLTLTGTNTYTGTLDVQGGTVIAATTANLGTPGSINVGTNGILNFNNSAQQDVSCNITGSGVINKTSTGVLIWNVGTTFSGTINISAGTIAPLHVNGMAGIPTVNLTGTGKLNIPQAFVNNIMHIKNLSGVSGTSVDPAYQAATGNRTLQITSTVDTTHAGTILTATSSRFLGLIKTGTARLTLSGNNTFTLGIRLQAGSLGMNTNNTAFGTGPLTAEGAAVSVFVLSTRTMANAITLNSGCTLTLDVASGFTLTASGLISSAGNLTFANSGTTLINNVSNSYTGTTSVAASHNLGGTGKLGTGLITVSGTLFGGTGASNAGTLTTGGAVTMASGAKLQVNIGTTTTVSKVAVTGNVTLNNTAVSFQAAALNAGTYDILTYTGTLTGTFATPSPLPTGRTFSSYTYDSVNKKVQVVLT